MKWTPRYVKSFSWHKWFAWYPVQVEDKDMVWLIVVWRRRECDWGDCDWKHKIQNEKPLNNE